MQRVITGFHRDTEGDWVAELACGHGQHVRHKPPWTVRLWVTTEWGRASKLGAHLECKRCGTIRPYASADRSACQDILLGKAGSASRRTEAQLSALLLQPPGPYFVVEDDDGAILACGGVAVDADEPKLAVLCCSAVRSDRRRRGLGRALTLHCLDAAPEGVERVRVRASREAQPFYERLGFVATSPVEGELDPGPNQVQLERSLAIGARGEDSRIE